MTKLLWWGYLHTSGTVQIKRYFSQLDLDEANESPFVQRSYGPFPASGRDEAEAILRKQFGKEQA